MATALITGGSSGIGFELAKLFAQDQYDVIITGRSKQELRRAKRDLEEFGIEVHAAAIDLAHPGAPRRIFNAVRALGPIDVLVNAAGLGFYGGFQHSDYDEQLYTLDTNVRGLTALTHLFLPQLVQRRGKILNISSIAGFRPGAKMATHYASQAYVHSFSEALAEELRGKVTVTTLAPGPTRTRFERRSRMYPSKASPTIGAMEAAEVACEGYAALTRADRKEVPGDHNKAIVPSRRILPTTTLSRISRKILERR